MIQLSYVFCPLKPTFSTLFPISKSLSKRIPYDSALPLPPLHRLSLAQAAVECRLAHAVLPENFVKRHFFFLPFCYELVKIRRGFFCRSSESHTALFCCRDSFRLTLTNGCALVFRNERQQLQDKVADECSEQIFIPSCIEKRHIYHHNIYFFLFCDDPPLVLNFLIIPSERVDT